MEDNYGIEDYGTDSLYGNSSHLSTGSLRFPTYKRNRTKRLMGGMPAMLKLFLGLTIGLPLLAAIFGQY